MTISEQQMIAGSILQNLRIVDPKAIVAGGAPRDWWMNKSCNDIDIYLTMPAHEKVEQQIKVFEYFGFSSIVLKGSEDNSYATMPGLLYVYSAIYQNQEINIMVMDYMNDNFIDSFSCSICKITYDGRALKPHKEFLRTVDSKIVLFYEPYTGKEKHIEKMIKRFPDYIFAKVYTDKEDDIDFLFAPLDK